MKKKYFLLILFIFISITNIYTEKTKFINDIHIIRKPVFYDYDKTKSSKKVYEFLNRLQVITLERTIKNDLLFDLNDILNVELLKNSERRLRSRDYIREAEIYYKEVSDTLADVYVVTSDQWSTVIGTTYKKTDDNENTLKIVFKETNLLGTGKTFKFKQDILNIDKSTKEFEYYDEHFFETKNLFFNYSYHQNLDKLDRKLIFGKDFASDFDEFSYYVNFDSYNDDKNSDIIYNNYVEIYLSNKVLINRIEVLLRYHQYKNIYKSETIYKNYIFSGVSFSSSNYIKEINLFKFGIIEDIKLGYEFIIGLKHISRAFGASLNGWGYETAYYYNKKINNNYYFFEILNDYTYANNYSEYINEINFNYIRKLTENINIRNYFTFEKIKTFKDIKYYGLGFNNRLRGYKNKYLEGNKYLILNSELTYFFKKDIFEFFRPAITLLYDVGRTYDDDENIKFKRFYHNIGLSFKMIMYKVDSVQEFNFTVAQPLKDKSSPYFSFSTSFDL